MTDDKNDNELRNDPFKNTVSPTASDNSLLYSVKIILNFL